MNKEMVLFCAWWIKICLAANIINKKWVLKKYHIIDGGFAAISQSE